MKENGGLRDDSQDRRTWINENSRCRPKIGNNIWGETLVNSSIFSGNW